NALRILERLARLVRRQEEAEKPASIEALSLMLPESHVLSGVQLEKASNAKDLVKALKEIGEALQPQSIEEAILKFGLSMSAIDSTIERAVAMSARWGVALPTPLLERALSAHFIEGLDAFLMQQVEAFHTLIQTEGHGLSAEAIAENWEALLALAAENELSLPSEIQERAQEAIRQFRGEHFGAALTEEEKRRVREASVPELRLMLEHPRYRLLAVLEVAARGESSQIEAVVKSIRKMPKNEVIEATVALLRFGEEAGDALIDGLGSKKSFVRHAFALALEHLKLRRSLVPLIHLLRDEPTEIWKDCARILASFGTSALRPIFRQMSEGGVEERWVLLVAHLANQVSESVVLEAAKGVDTGLMALAQKGIQLREEAKKLEEQALGRIPADDPHLAFAARFHQALAEKLGDFSLHRGSA
ncbi:MAG: hypothetical protein NZM37_13110, partial [Sandaracinaceae bacterium]|nr:hypothetical protein [Sandaracinaceae bacterium]